MCYRPGGLLVMNNAVTFDMDSGVHYKKKSGKSSTYLKILCSYPYRINNTIVEVGHTNCLLISDESPNYCILVVKPCLYESVFLFAKFASRKIAEAFCPN